MVKIEFKQNNRLDYMFTFIFNKSTYVLIWVFIKYKSRLF